MNSITANLDPDKVSDDRRKFQLERPIERHSDVFARNLNRLTIMNGLSRKEAAKKVGANYLWYRRAVTAGLCRISKRTRPILKRIVLVFGLTAIDDLWEPDLIRFERSSGLKADAEPPKEPWAAKLAIILATGKHDYLKDLIDTIYRTVDGGIEQPTDGAPYWSSGGGDDNEDDGDEDDGE